LKNSMEDNERVRELKNDAVQHIELAKQSLEAAKDAEIQISTHAIENRIITESLRALTTLLDRYRGEVTADNDKESSN
ncbi:MAG: hypothetical protein PHI31_16495, partial [Desulfuromonadaceae bacterium]|nr:hypothetical protein [Desulfuromonadaceae bacterium]